MNICKAIIFLQEIPTDGHSPMKFICDNGSVYYCKYRVNYKLEEIDFLTYEVICHYLLRELNIPTPDIALVELIEGTFLPTQLKQNKNFARPGVICFGSKEIKNSNLVTGLELANNPESLNLIYNPYDIIRIAIFDLWVDNVDRGRNENYNLLTSAHHRKLKIWAFDHAFTFGGVNSLRIFNNKYMPNITGKLIKTSYFQSLVKLLDPYICTEIIENTIQEFKRTESIIQDACDIIPPEWIFFPNLRPKIQSFLLDSSRIEAVRQLALSEFIL